MVQIITKESNLYCDFCGGVGHEYKACTTRKKIDQIARSRDVLAEWGKFKYDHFIKGTSRETVVNFKQLPPPPKVRRNSL